MFQLQEKLQIIQADNQIKVEKMKKIVLALTFGLIGLNMIAQESKTLMKIENDIISVDDFLAIYNKNNTSNVVDKKSMDEYLDLFINFKLKVKAAEDLGMDTAGKFINELAGYRKQLAQPYLVDRAMNDQLIQEAYDRMTQDVSAYHTLVKVPDNASPADTTAALKKLMGYAKGIKTQKDMEDAVARIKSLKDESVITEDLGYFTAFSMVYPFESAAYNTPVGTLSKTVRTRFGYHVIFVKDKRPARGEIRVSHIMVRSSSEMNPEDQKRAEEKVNELYDRLEQGEDFGALAKEFSDDKGSARNEGRLPWFGTGRMVPSFEDAAFALEQNGQISEPVRTNYGWHIIKRDEYKGIASFDELESSIKKRIERDSRGQKGKASLLKKLKEEYALSYNLKNRDAINKLVNSDYLEGKWIAPEEFPKDGVVFTITDNVYSNETMNFTQKDYLNYLQKFQRKSTEEKKLSTLLKTQWEGFVDESLITFEDKVLDAKYPEFRALMQEYHDGILLFDLMDQKVWTKAVKDSAGLAAFYETHKNDFMWGERVDASVYICENGDIAKKAMKLAKKRLKKGYTDSYILDEVNDESALSLSIRSGIYSAGDDEYIDKASFEPGIYELPSDASEAKKVIVQVYKKMDPQPKSLNEARGLVTSAYQNQLEADWISALREKYSFTVDNEVFKSIQN